MGLAAILAYLVLIAAVGRAAWRAHGTDRMAGILLALLMLTIPAWVMGAYWLVQKLL
jgi:hypothetical protein